VEQYPMSSSPPALRAGRMVTRMRARDRDKAHLTATSLELFFDLCFVVAVAQAGAGLVHALAENHPGTGVTGYLCVFFGI
jgi:low temperature requirement protein LtrA